jgi:thiol-disulfide isomerase/thioredoxin
VLSKHKLILVGFSSYSCHKCIQVEPAYRNISDQLKGLKIPFARADADKMKSIAAEVGATELPTLVLFQKLRPIVYRGAHSVESVMQYIHKQLDPPAKTLKSVAEVENFLASRANTNYGVTTAMTVGFFSDHTEIEEDDYEEFITAAKELQLNEDTYFGVVTNPAVSKWFKKNRTIDRTPALLMHGEGAVAHAINLDELYGDNAGIAAWVVKNALPLVGKMTGQNFLMYEKQGLPILMMFLDLTEETSGAATPGMVGGKSGGIHNELLLEEFRLAAKEHQHRVLFVYLDGVLHGDQMKSLGLYGGRERLPSLAFNTRDRSQVPFPEELPINKDTILQFVADFISGKLRSIDDTKEMAKKALQSALPINPKNQAVRKEKKKAPPVVQGVSEQFGDGIRGDQAVVTVTLKNFQEVAMNEDKDVVLLLHAQDCEPCAHFAVYFKRMADRFMEMGVPSLVIARMDVSSESPPAELNLMVGDLPLLVMLPAGPDKRPPWTFYSGVGKIQEMMKWVHAQVSVPFALENLPHLSEVDKQRYKDQVREREEALDKKRTEERLAMAAEERAQAEVKRRKRNLEKQKTQVQAAQEQTQTQAQAQIPTQTASADTVTTSTTVNAEVSVDGTAENDSDEF